MGTRLTLRQATKCKAAIQTTQIIKRLQKHVLGEIELTSTQVTAANVLLKKTLPDLAVTHVGPDEGSAGKFILTIANG